MKILFVITGLGMGGAEIQVVSLADRLSKLGHEITVISITGQQKVFFNDKKINVINLDSNKTIKSFFLMIFRIKRILKEINPDIVHSHMVHANLISRLLRLTTKINRLVCTAHSTNEGGRIRSIAYRSTNFLCDYFTNVSNVASQTFVNKGIVKEGGIHCVYNGIDTEKFTFNSSSRDKIINEFKISKKDRIFIAVGRFTDPKDYPNLLSAYVTLVKKNDHTHLIIVGDGPLRADIERFITQNDLGNSITLTGVRSDIAELMSASDFFILPSKFEGFGLVVAEAMACNRLVIATDSGGVKEVLGGHGFLVEAQNSLALSASMQEALFLSDETYRSITSQARIYVLNNFSLDNIVQQWLNIYNEK
jgi:glycosyltransferase involved in cell wall biosynthesis